MKRIFKVFTVVALALCIALLTCGTAAAEDSSSAQEVATVTQSGSSYVLSGIGEARSFSSLGELIEASGGAHLLFAAVCAEEDITVRSDAAFSGALRVDGSLKFIGGKFALRELNLTVSRGAIEIRGADLTVDNSDLTLNDSNIVMSYSASDVLEIKNSDIRVKSDKAALVLDMGTARIKDTTIASEHSYAILNRGSLYLSGESSVSGFGWGVYTERPMHLSYLGEPLTEPISVLWSEELMMGGFYKVLLDCEEFMVDTVSLFGADGEEAELSFFEKSEGFSEENFIAVSLPYKITYYASGEKYLEQLYYSGELTSPPPCPERAGYKFLSWKDRQSAAEFSFGKAIEGDAALEASFSLLAPTYSIADINAEYSATPISLGFDYISHPLLSQGALTYSWYKNGEALNSSVSELELLSVSDSGEYYCKLTFAYKGDIVTIDTKTVTVNISKMKVQIPKLEPLVYSGSEQAPALPESEYYTADPSSGVEAGFYSVSLKLKDTENTVWESGDEGAVAYTVYEIKRAENYFKIPPKGASFYEGEPITIVYTAAFGEGEILFSEDGISYAADAPNAVGEYFAKVVIREGKSYGALTSEPVKITVLSDTASALVIESAPDKLSYLAFDVPDLSGARVKAIMKSGAERYLELSDLSVRYANGSYLSACDSCVYLEYRGASIPLGIRVKRREYSLSGFIFESAELIYNGKRRTLAAQGTVVGLDGIALEYRITGGGINAGEYEIRAVFSTESAEYEIPNDEVRALRILPMPVALTYTELSFVYDGAPKLPMASFTDAGGARRWAQLKGASSVAGEHTVTAINGDPNYTYLNPSASFVIEKAVIDISGIRFTENRLVYNGKKQSVSICSIPEALTVVGYINASFTDAGKYVAEAIVEYDSDNYHPPKKILFEWEIEPAEYDMSGAVFSDSEFVFDAAEHYPELKGKMPVGLDGSSPSYAFSCGATHVSEGWVEVSVSFTADSGNYNTPATVSARVRIIPKAIVVQWGCLEFVYDGGEKLPLAYSEAAEISVSGGAIGAGEYTAVASAKSSDYKVINPSASFKIKKAENAWVKYPKVDALFFGREISVTASAVSGEVKFKVYKDKEMKIEAEYPLVVNKYFLFAYVDEGENYLRLSSEPIEFEVLPIDAIGLEINILKDSFLALDSVIPEDFEAALIFSDGSEKLIPSESVVLDIEGGRLKKGEISLRFSYLGFESERVISVKGRELDVSRAYWTGTEQIYTGEAKVSLLEGLPEGVRVKKYLFNSATDAGVYKLSCELEYDEDYYLEPNIPQAYLVIKKATVYIPEFDDLVYNGKAQAPDLQSTDIYTVTLDAAIHAGEYPIKITLTDPDNYALSDASLSYRILPRELEISVGSSGRDYTVTSGEIIEGDSLGEEYYKEGGEILIRINNPDYRVRVIGKDSFEGGVVLLITLFFIIIALAIFVFVGRRDIIFAVKKRESDAPFPKEDTQPRPSEPVNKAQNGLGTLFQVDERAANRLISDLLAKDLVKDKKVRVRTEGRKRGSINIGRISESYESGARVDINSLKAKGLIPKDVCNIKVLGGGVVDKPLHIMANSFSLSAVKMIALTGGTAERTVNIK